MRPVRRVGTVVLCIVVYLSTASLAVVQRSESAAYNPSDYISGAFAGCAATGDGGDPYQNQSKNRDLQPRVFKTWNIVDLLNFQPKLALQMGKLDRSKWSSAAYQQIAELEENGIIVEGYLVGCKKQGPESCNCYNKKLCDYHLWLAASPDDSEAQAMVVEITPRLLIKHKGWIVGSRRAIMNKLLVRISAWGMWDGEHRSLIGVTRATLAEGHPILKIEVTIGKTWVEL